MARQHSGQPDAVGAEGIQHADEMGRIETVSSGNSERHSLPALACCARIPYSAGLILLSSATSVEAPSEGVSGTLSVVTAVLGFQIQGIPGGCPSGIL